MKLKNAIPITLICLTTFGCKNNLDEKHLNNYEVVVDTAVMQPASATNDTEHHVGVDTAKNEYDFSKDKRTKEEKRAGQLAIDKFFGTATYTLGSSEEDVLDIQGQPTSVSQTGPYKTFIYKTSSLTFYNGKLEEFTNNGNLKIKVRSKRNY